MKIYERFLHLTCFSTVIILCLACSVDCQKRVALNRNDVVVNKQNASVYLCVERNQEDSTILTTNNVLVKLVNNTIWVLKLNTSKLASETRSLKLSNGAWVAGARDGTVIYPVLKYASTRKNWVESNESPEVFTSSWVPSDSSVRFTIPREKLDNASVAIEFKYEWELIGSSGQESYSPIHSIHLELRGDSLKKPVCH